MEDAFCPAPLRQSLRRLQWSVAVLAALVLLLAIATAWLAVHRPHPLDIDAISTRQLQVLDDKGIVRVQIGQDGTDTGRYSRSAGLLIFDATGAERGGIGTFDDGSAAIALDAPSGIGEEAFRDRAGMRVEPDGSSQILLTDNLTRGVVRLRAHGDGGGGLDTFKWDMQGKVMHTRSTTFDGDERTQQPIGEPD